MNAQEVPLELYCEMIADAESKGDLKTVSNTGAVEIYLIPSKSQALVQDPSSGTVFMLSKNASGLNKPQ